MGKRHQEHSFTFLYEMKTSFLKGRFLAIKESAFWARLTVPLKACLIPGSTEKEWALTRKTQNLSRSEAHWLGI